MQRLEILTAQASLPTQTLSDAKEEILDIIGVKIPFESPFYLFFFVDDLINNDEDWVHFIGYQMKSPGPAFWGRLHKTGEQPIQMKGSCTYRTNLIGQMVKQWKANGFQYGSGSVKDRSIERIIYYLRDDTKNGFDEIEQLKTIASFYRGEIDKLPSSIDKTKVKDFMRKMELMELNDPEDIIRTHSKIDREGTNKKRSRKKGIINFINYKEYERYKAFVALEEGKITKKQFETLFPWEYTLDLMEQIIYDDLEIDRENREIGSDIKNDYKQDYKIYVTNLKKSIDNYEEGLNRIDPTALINKISQQVKNFFYKLEQRKIKILPKEPCPELKNCLNLDGTINQSIETCEVYFYPSSEFSESLA